MKKKLNTKRMAVLLALCLAFTAIPGMASAAETESTDVKGYITTAATELSYTITPTVTLSASAESDVLDITKILIQNSQGVGRLQVYDVALNKTKNGWEIKPSETNFKSMPLNSRKFSLVATLGNTTKDLSKGKLNMIDYYVNAGTTEEVSFTGRASGTTYQKTEEALLLVVTVCGEYLPSYTSMTINDEIFNVDYGMTWGQWVASDYSRGVFALDGNCIKIINDPTKFIYESTAKTYDVKDIEIVPRASYITKTKN